MAVVLALDTCAPVASIALLLDAGPACVRFIPSSEGHAHLLFAVVDDVLRQAGIKLDGVDCFAAASGPGSFTGLRVSLSAIKGLAFAQWKPAVAVSSLKALAWYGSAQRRTALLDARRGEVFVARFDATLAPLSAESAIPLEQCIAELEPGMEIITPAPELCPGISVVQAPPTHAEAVAHIARAAFLNGLAVHPASIEANYVRRSDAEMKWQDVP
jgi:tRNA threonylcarbamoyladenosine biosynthesis protein TsaB